MHRKHLTSYLTRLKQTIILKAQQESSTKHSPSEEKFIEKILNADNFEDMKRMVGAFTKRHTTKNPDLALLTQIISESDDEHQALKSLNKAWTKSKVSNNSLLSSSIPENSVNQYQTLLALDHDHLFSIIDRFFLEAVYLRLDKRELLCDKGTSTPLKDPEQFLCQFLKSVTNLEKAILKNKPYRYLASDMLHLIDSMQVMLRYIETHPDKWSIEDTAIALMGKKGINLKEFMRENLEGRKTLLSDHDSKLFVEYTELCRKLYSGVYDGQSRQSYKDNPTLKEAYKQYLRTASNYFGTHDYHPPTNKESDLNTLGEAIKDYYFGPSKEMLDQPIERGGITYK
ncbi:hypothetical protein [Legionella sp. W05-934-2]|uniref:hypothetical protein n=1 Tax=Legionella sp. W05-934-2 TaxID=1198649 RepID=UPI0034635AE1